MSTVQSISSPGGRVSLRWDAPEGADVQRWHLCRCDYPVRNDSQVKALLSGGLDLMMVRWEVHPSATGAIDDTGGTEGKHYVVLGEVSRGDLYVARNLAVADQDEGSPLSKLKRHQGWVPAAKGRKDRYSNVF